MFLYASFRRQEGSISHGLFILTQTVILGWLFTQWTSEVLIGQVSGGTGTDAHTGYGNSITTCFNSSAREVYTLISCVPV